MEVKINIPIKPVPHQSVRVTRFGRTYQPKRIADYKQQIQEAVREQLPSGFSCIKADTPIAVTKLHYVFQYPKSMPKYKRESSYIQYKVTKPDLHDNLFKAVIDAMEGIIFTNDSRIVKLENAQKIWGIVGYTEISLLNSIN